MNTRKILVQKGDFYEVNQRAKESIYYLQSGYVKLCELDADGNEFMKDHLTKGDLLGVCLSNSSSPVMEYIVVISSKATLLEIPKSVFNHSIQSNGRFAAAVVNYSWGRYLKVESMYKRLSYQKNTKNRLANFILEWAKRDGKINGDSATITNYLTHKDIASLICSTRATVTRLMNEFRTDGQIHYTTRCIKILDLKLLENID
ncbi:MAG: Crp/Fnr family transcriptional regulator [Bacteroidota bacterium]